VQIHLRNLISKFFAVSFLVFSLSACSLDAGVKTAESSITEFHKLLDDMKYQQIYKDADQKLQKAAAFDRFSKLLSAIHRKLGNVKDSKSIGWHVNVVNGTQYVRLTYNTEFEHGKGQEQFTWIISGEKAKLAGYYMTSDDMMIH
jgi:S-adenosylmethionine hydrolase